MIYTPYRRKALRGGGGGPVYEFTCYVPSGSATINPRFVGASTTLECAENSETSTAASNVDHALLIPGGNYSNVQVTAGGASVTSLNLNRSVIRTYLTEAVLSSLTSLETLEFGYCNALTELDLSGLASLEEITSQYGNGPANITDVDLTGCTGLLKAQFSKLYDLASCDFTPCTSLEELNLFYAGVTSLVVGTNLPTSLTKLEIGDCSSLTTLNLTGCSSLTQVTNAYNRGLVSLTSVTLTGCTSLTVLGLGGFGGTSVDLTPCTSLVTLSFSKAYSIEVISSVPSTVQSIDISDCDSLETLDVSGLTALTTVTNYYSRWLSSLTSVDVSSCPALTSLNLGGATSLSQSQVDGVLSDLVANGASNGSVYMLHSAIPSAAGLADKATLEADGWTVTVAS